MKNNYLILSNSFSHGGGERIAVNIANGLRDAEENVTSFIIEDKVTYPIHNDIKVFKPPYKFNMPIFGKFLNNVIALLYLIYVIKKMKVDIVISHLFRANYMNVVASYITGHKSVITTHGSISKYMDGRFSSKINLRLIKFLFNKADKKVFLTERMRDDYLPYVGPQNNVVIPNCYDLDAINNYAQECISDNPFKVKDYFIFVGRFHPVKRIDLILDVMSKSGENLLLVGDGEEYKCLYDKYASERIVFLGSRVNPYPYMKNARAIILASESEGFPNVIVEALALGVSVISSDCRTGPREILQVSLNSSFKDALKLPCGGLFHVNDRDGLIILLRWVLEKKLNKEECQALVREYGINCVVRKYIRCI